MPQVQNKGKMRTLFKKPSPFFPRAKVLGRAFRNFTTHETTTHIVRYGGKRRFFRVPIMNATKDRAACDFAMMKIFHLLYPQYSVKPVGVTLLKGEKIDGVGIRYGVVSEIVRGLNPSYKKFQESFYRMDNSFRERAIVHEKFSRLTASPIAKKIYKESGIIVESGVNVGNKKGVPIFFEPSIDLTSFSKFKRFVLSQPKEKAQEIIELLEVIRKAKIN